MLLYVQNESKCDWQHKISLYVEKQSTYPENQTNQLTPRLQIRTLHMHTVKVY